MTPAIEIHVYPLRDGGYGARARGADSRGRDQSLRVPTPGARPYAEPGQAAKAAVQEWQRAMRAWDGAGR